MPAPTTVIDLPDGRVLALDDLGDRAGAPVVYLHGTPDCRLARHPDATEVAPGGVRLLAVDRPGFGASTPDPAGDLRQLGRDLGVALDGLGVDRVGLLGWSAGGLAALAAASDLGERVAALTLVGTLAPIESALDPLVVAALGPGRRAFVEMATALRAEGATADDLAAEVAPYLVPDPLDDATARSHVLEAAGAVGRGELDQVPGAVAQLTGALVASVAAGREGLVHDIARQLEVGLDLAAVDAPVRTIHGADDPVSPPPVGTWLAARLGRCSVEAVPTAGHHLLLPRWAEIVRLAAP